MRTTLQRICCAIVAAGACLLAVPAVEAASLSPIVVTMPAQDLVYSKLDDAVYASLPNSSALNPNSLTPINPYTGALGSPVAIGFEPRHLAVSSDGVTLYAVFSNNFGYRPYNVVTQTVNAPFVLSGGRQIKEIYSIPGRPQAVMLVTHMPQFSPPATGTMIVENNVKLPNQVGDGLGSGGPDTAAVDPTDGTRAYGYQTTVSSYTHWSMTIGATGVTSSGTPPLQNILTNSLGRLELLGNVLFTNRGEVYSMSPPLQIAAFVGGNTFVLDPVAHLLFSVTSNNSTHTIRAYSTDTYQLLGTDLVTGVPGTADSLIRFGAAGLAFRTNENRVVFVQSPQLVPEPAAFALAVAGALGAAAAAGRRRTGRSAAP
jgi:hypothetical protein